MRYSNAQWARSKFCSRACQYVGKDMSNFVPPLRGKKNPNCSGPRHHLWRGGITKEHDKIRRSYAYKDTKPPKEFGGDGGDMKIAFDVDDTLIIPSVALDAPEYSPYNVPNYEVIAVYRFFQAQGHDMIIWSGSGVDWAKTWGEKLGLRPFTVRMKEQSEDVDIAFDDCDVTLARVNVKVKRVNNWISRADWNKNKQLTPLE